MDHRPPSPDFDRDVATSTQRTSLLSAEGRLAQLVDARCDDWEAAERSDAADDRRFRRDGPSSLVEARLGIASSLFTAMRWKHEPTAQHCLRVALCCSGWAELMGLPDELRDDLELAALLHDVGKIGVLDSILGKPGTLNAARSGDHGLPLADGRADSARQLRLGSECSRRSATLARWFDGTRGGCDSRGDELPLGSRMLAIVDAFDSMTTDQVYRRAMSVQRAFDELYRCAGTQFDPDLVTVFSKLFEKDPLAMQQRASASGGWRTQSATRANGQWRRGDVQPSLGAGLGRDRCSSRSWSTTCTTRVIFVDASQR